MIKLLEANYGDGFSYVKIKTDCGIFNGVAELHPEDGGHGSEFLGCEIAEYRATIKYFKKKRGFLAQQLLSLVNLKRDYDRANIDKESSAYKILIKRIDQMENQKKEYDDAVKSLKTVINARIDGYAEIIKKLRKKDSE